MQEYAFKQLFDQEKEHGNDANDEALRARLQFVMDCRGLSVFDVAAKIGGEIRSREVYNFINNDSADPLFSDIPHIRESVVKYLQREEDPLFPLQDPLFCQTTIALKIAAVCQCAKQDRDIGLILGASGIGKTACLKEVKRQDREVILVTADPTQRSIGAILLLISKSLPGISRGGRRSSEFMAAIIDYLRGSARLLVIDEGHFLSWESIEAVRRIYDATGIGVVFSGQQLMLDQMRGGRKSMLFDQIKPVQ